MDEAKEWDDKLSCTVSWVWGERRYALTADALLQVERSPYNRECLSVNAAGFSMPLTIERLGAPFANTPSFMEGEVTVASRELHTVRYTERGQTRAFIAGRTKFLLEWEWEGSES